jgi:GNAT superfamily N-acetyltransferase
MNNAQSVLRRTSMTGQGDMNIQIATTDNDIQACYTVMSELRPHIPEDAFVERVRDMQRQGYVLVAAMEEGAVVAVAGVRIDENLAWGRFLYVADLVTKEDCRSRGYGKALLSWLREFAKAEGCAQMHLDSGMQRKDAHRFYLREGMEILGYHFSENLCEETALA